MRLTGESSGLRLRVSRRLSLRSRKRLKSKCVFSYFSLSLNLSLVSKKCTSLVNANHSGDFFLDLLLLLSGGLTSCLSYDNLLSLGSRGGDTFHTLDEGGHGALATVVTVVVLGHEATSTAELVRALL